MPLRTLPALLLCTLAIVGCSPDRPSPTGPAVGSEMEPALYQATSASRFETVSVGSSINCGLTEEGLAFCWTPGDEPSAVGSEFSFASISAGDRYACALEVDGDAYCWGDNMWGTLGDGTTEDRVAPAPVVGDHRFRTISAGSRTTCAVDVDGDIWCWGLDQPTPGQITDGGAFADVDVGRRHTCALDEGGAAWCWGDNLWGELGDGTTERRVAPTAVVGGHRFASISAGNSFTCALTGEGAAYCWGKNELTGVLGIGVDGPDLSSTPLPVTGGHTFESITAGEIHACALDADSAAWCWGGGENGELGVGFITDVSEPTAVSGDHRFADIDAGRWRTCALLLDGEAYCWGLLTGNSRQLVPFPVSAPTKPGQPVRASAVGDLEIWRPAATAIQLFWTEVDDGLGEPAWYRVKYSTPPLDDWKNATVGCDRTLKGTEIGEGRWCWVEGLEPDTEYEFQLMSYRMVDGVWQGAAYSNIARGHTDSDRADPAPTRVDDLEVADIGSSTVTLRWTQVDDGTGTPASYRLRYGSPLHTWKDGTIGCERTIEGTEIGATITCTVEDLAPETQYGLQLMSFRSVEGHWVEAIYSNTVFVRTGAVRPDATHVVDDLEVTDATSSTLTLRWTQVEDGIGEPASYRVRYGSPLGIWKEGAIGCQAHIEGTAVGATSTCTVEGLDAGITYDLQLYSYRLEDGKWVEAWPSNRAEGTTASGS